jgi:HAD superfamily hydrolase (TIGR01509 family)
MINFVFDVGEVLIHRKEECDFLSPEDIDFYETGLSRQKYILEECDRGRHNAWAIAEMNKLWPEKKTKNELYVVRYTELLELKPDVLSIAQALRIRGHHVSILSDWWKDWVPEILEKFPAMKWFDGYTWSGHVGFAKPDKEIYELHTGLLGLNPYDCVFIDDRLENLDGAERAGWSTILFTNGEELKSSLEDLIKERLVSIQFPNELVGV